MPETKHPLKVFLCHASADKQKVRELYRYLRRRGIRPWFDEVDLVGGQDWQIEIPKALSTSDAIIICLTKNSVDKEGYIQKEIKFALDKALEMPEGRIFLIPIRFEECEVPFSLSRYQWVDLTIESGYSKMMKALKFRASQLERATVELLKKDLEEEKQLALVRAAREKEARDAAEKTAQEKAEREINEKAERERAEKARRDNMGGEAVENAFQEKQLEVSPSKMEMPEVQKTKTQRKPNMAIIVGLIGFAGTIATLLISPLIEKRIFPVPTQLPTLNSISQTDEANLPIEIIDIKGIPMRLVPASSFTMGTESGENDEKPVHTVYLNAFYIDKFEVANVLYKACVDRGVCESPKQDNSYTRSSYYNNSEFDYYPVIYVDWNMAKTYCEWRGAELPTEAQWEKAARGMNERSYPWGNNFECKNGNFDDETQMDSAVVPGGTNCDGYLDTAPIGSYENGKSPYGVYEMAGNVGEWASSLYLVYPYSLTDGREDLITLGNRVLRGGSWVGLESSVTSTNRNNFNMSIYENNTGFRCARNTSP